MYIKKEYAKLWPIPGTTVKQLRLSLADKTPNRVIIHGGCNDVSNKNTTHEQIANDIADIAVICCGHGVNKVNEIFYFVLSIMKKVLFW